MKKLLILLAVAGIGLYSCEMENDPNPTVNGESNTVPVIYPEMFLVGPDYVVLSPGGGPYTDAGARVYDFFKSDTLPLSSYFNNVDPATEGFYSVKYKYKNEGGYESSIIRVVLVTSVDPNMDISGFYRRTGNNSPVNITKVDRGLYWNDNIAGSTPILAYMGFINNTTVAVTDQLSATGGEVSCDGTTFSMDATDTTYSWIVHAAGFGTGRRTFTHQ